ncbi:NIL domain-containing protein [Aetokthonos hydrillicola Thurmond2011]|jgi:ABC-type methionine transport system ATPase subunit|uniref:NIL domain-containing protein n=1 Tax=Aetokthonos hydrillicola Thurmond2011 TaxID=2712845 RepID=A0AAP5M836_9CYAN|nr:NIL domain-containing protein [Aetokthonos hydrillicola]MBO3461416.1 NIL domain-containing protein [Aetokthonos hydrillicola CCALA 1050]MBW4586852.1 NIL domain-containing protein [Aetokthonos hydrillicola CCALA 1050]MDR9895790.1 NIL domain-containing protein [Aetokthonos hydrillicola Thurmond2011]
MALSTEQVTSTTIFKDNRRTEKRVRIYIPKNLHGEPVISNIISRYQVTINIRAAQLGSQIPQEGYFDLEIRGKAYQIENVLSYLNGLHVEIEDQLTTEELDGW